MTAAEQKAFAALENQVKELTSAVTALTMAVKDVSKQIDAPKWFVTEFGSADVGGLINTPQMTFEGWHSTTIGLRTQGLVKERNEKIPAQPVGRAGRILSERCMLHFPFLQRDEEPERINTDCNNA
ncbi:hypothetical protein [Cohnella hongkongensis]|uniref:Uncharacterized protein n=1 Tax=Cohnella hongkongensis TaxID=178337 RepID=A0ABV9FAY2_9BACL